MTASHAFAKPGRYALQLAVTNDLGHVATASRLFEFACPSGSVEPWTAADVGSPAFAGGSRLEGPAENSCFSICAGGDDLLSGPSDQFHFVEREFTGDAVLTARVDGFSGGAGAAVGLMFRKDLSAGAAHASILLVNSGGGKYWFLRRELDGQSTKPPTRSAGTFTLPAWIRLERKGGMITGSYSEVDPPAEADWKVLQTIPDFLPGPILAGIAANGKDPGPGSPFVALSATVCLPESPPPAPRFLRGDCNGDRIADLSDAVCILGWLFLGGAKPVCVAAANTNLDGAADISDATYLLSHLFLGGPAPPEPFPDCGPANSPEDLRLGCEDGCR